MLTANRPDARTCSWVPLAELRHTSSIGGSIDNDDTALTVIPCGRSAWPVVITTTPVMKLLITRRNTELSTAGKGTSGAASPPVCRPSSPPRAGVTAEASHEAVAGVGRWSGTSAQQNNSSCC